MPYRLSTLGHYFSSSGLEWPQQTAKELWFFGRMRDRRHRALARAVMVSTTHRKNNPFDLPVKKEYFGTPNNHPVMLTGSLPQ